MKRSRHGGSGAADETGKLGLTMLSVASRGRTANPWLKFEVTKGSVYPLAALALLGVAAADVPAPVAVRLDADTILIPGGFAPGRQPDGNSIVMAGPRGTVVFDTGRHVSHSNAVSAAVAAIGKPLLAIVNSHWHLDHVSGNLPLNGRWPAARVYASDAIDDALTGFLARNAEGARAQLARGDLPADSAADVRHDLATFARGTELRPNVVVGGTLILAPGGRRFALHVARRAATAGDVWLYDAAHARLLAGDLVTLPAPFLDTACPDGWRVALATLAATPFRQLVPGHGGPMDRAAFGRYRTAFGRLLDCATGQADAERCAAGWLADAGPLVAPAERDRATRLVSYYIGQVRGGALRANCTV